MSVPTYATTEQVAAVMNVDPSAHSPERLLRAVRTASRLIERTLHRQFYPLTTTITYRLSGGGAGFWLERDLLSISAATSEGVAVTVGDIEVSPAEAPYSWVDIAGVDVTITGDWGYSNDTNPAGALAVAVSNDSDAFVTVTNESLVGIGDVITADSERMNVTAKAMVDTTANLASDLAESDSDVTVTLDDGSLVNEGERILIGSERMLVTDVAGNDATVVRAVDGTTLAAHTGSLDVYAPRKLTVERGAQGSTADTHLQNAALTKNAPPEPIVTWAIAEALMSIARESTSYGFATASGQEIMGAIGDIRDEGMRYRRVRMATI